ncbi:MAG: response regulator [Phormidesmis sp. CAN_BIN36]|nr:response regulator [Phormidesmis sp. CAN_BIN36]
MRRQLAPAIIYYIRRLLHQHHDRLTFPIVDNIGKKADANTNLGEILASLYVKEQKIDSVTFEIERLALLHQSLSQASVKDLQDLQNVEKQIFGLLGCELKGRASSMTFRGNTTLAYSSPGTDRTLGLRSILLVDAEPASRHLLSTALTYNGYQVYTANDGREAVESVQRLHPDAVLLDVVLPDLNGYGVCEQLKVDRLTQKIPVLFVSAVNNVASKVKAFHVGGVDYITKPFHLEEILVRVEHQVNIYCMQKQQEEQTSHLQQEIRELKQSKVRLYQTAL